MKKIIALVVVIALLGIIIFLSFQRVNTSMKQKKHRPEEQAYSVGAFILKKSMLVETVTGHAIVKGNPQVKVYTAGNVSGLFIRNIYKEGDYVKKDTVIAYIDRNSPGDSYGEVPVNAPIDGIITKLYFLDRGSKVLSTDPVAEIANVSSLKLSVNLGSSDIVKVKQNQNALITSDFKPGMKINAKVGSVTPFIDTDSLTGEATIIVDNMSNDLQIGLSVNVEIEITKREAYLVPDNAVILNDELTYVYINENNIARQAIVKTGYSNKGYTEISGNIKDGDQIINEGNFKLNDGDKINIVSE